MFKVSGISYKLCEKKSETKYVIYNQKKTCRQRL